MVSLHTGISYWHHFHPRSTKKRPWNPDGNFSHPKHEKVAKMIKIVGWALAWIQLVLVKYPAPNVQLCIIMEMFSENMKNKISNRSCSETF